MVTKDVTEKKSDPFSNLIQEERTKLDLPGQYGVSATFNVSDLSPFELDSGDRDSRTNPFEEEITGEFHIFFI